MAAPRTDRARRQKATQLIESLETIHGCPRLIARFSPMDELISCILSQHTNDANSFPTFTRLVETYRTWDAVIAAGADAIADTIRNAGLANQKSKSIIACLTTIREVSPAYDLEFLRAMPLLEARAWLMKLPGVGPKTASIVLCFAMGLPTIPVDTHVYRVSWRFGLIPEDLGEVKAHDDLLKAVPPDLSYRYHIALIQHGRTICRAPLPDCKRCPVAEQCRWKRSHGPEKRQEELSKARRKTTSS